MGPPTEMEADGLPWWPASVRRRGGARSTLTIERIVEAGVELVEKEGFDALTMRRVADSLQCGVMSLYWHVANRDELVSVVVDELLRGVPTPSSDLPWRQQIVVVCRAFVAILYRHRRVLAGFPGGLAPGPQLLRMTNDVYGALRSAGFAGADLFEGVDAISSLTLGSLFAAASLGTSEDPEKVEDGSATNAAPRRVQDIDFRTLDPRRYPHLAAAGARRADRPNGFELALGIVLDGLELRLGSSRPGAAGGGPAKT